jgi:hypothetical protein
MTDKHIRRMNRKVLAFPDWHPAKMFLLAFLQCRRDCIGQHHSFDGQSPIDQAWISSADGKQWLFSEFAYMFLAFDVELDGFENDAPKLTDSEIAILEQLPYLRLLMRDCTEAAKREGNKEILKMNKQVLEMLGLWEDCIRFRESVIKQSN